MKFQNVIYYSFFAIFLFLLSSCQQHEEAAPIINFKKSGIEAKISIPQNTNIIKTPKGAQVFDLETPLRCSVNWQTQQMITSIPYNVKAFNLVQNGNNDLMPRFEVTGFSFETMPAEKALLKLTKEAGIKLIAKDPPYASISAENLRGELSEVIKMIADAAEIYYSYDAHNKTLRISRKANFSLYVPKSRPILLALLDVLRGSGITDITSDWDDYSITFDADFELKNKILTLIGYFEENPLLIAFDVYVVKVYPTNPQKDIQWQSLLNTFDYGTIKSAKNGVIGRVLTTSNDLNIEALNVFLSMQGRVEPVAQGKFVVPNLWYARFDVGKCGQRQSIDANLSILAKASIEQNNKIFSNITLDSTEGEVTQFSIRSQLGENFLIIGIPNELFGSKDKNSQTIVFMVPRIIRTMKTTQHLQNKI